MEVDIEEIKDYLYSLAENLDFTGGCYPVEGGLAVYLWGRPKGESRSLERRLHLAEDDLPDREACRRELRQALEELRRAVKVQELAARERQYLDAANALDEYAANLNAGYLFIRGGRVCASWGPILDGVMVVGDSLVLESAHMPLKQRWIKETEEEQ